MTGVRVRTATREDVPAIVALLVDDALGATRETNGEHTAYLTAFEAIDADPAHELVVLEDGGEVIGTLQLSLLPSLSRGGALRAQVEAVRVASSRRGQGLGEELFRWAIDEARRRGAVIVQLTTDASRDGAHRFYERLGFVASHVGMKLPL
ncbi:MAG: GNAT family N-acetyltransferase [Knoellia sp.]